MGDMQDFLAMLQKKADKSSEPKLDHDVQVVRLKEAYSRYTRDNPFVVGDWVTPLADVGLYGAGEPHIVIETRSRANAPPHMSGENSGASTFGMRHDVRILSIMRDCLTAHWTESATLELWKGEH